MKHPDLNLLIALNILLEEGSVAKAAERMHLSAPAMSRTLTRIRLAFHDPILVRAGRKLVPTPKALELKEQIKQAVIQSVGLFQANHVLDLKTLKRNFTLRANEVFIGAFEQAILEKFREIAPQVQLRFVPENDIDDDALREGRIELFIGALQNFEPVIKVQRLFDSYQVGLARKEHPIFNQQITVESYASYEHISISRRARDRGPIDVELAELGLERKIPLVKHNFLAGVFSLLNSDLIMGCPEHLLPIVLQELPLRAFAIPVPLKPVTIIQAWHPRFDNDLAHQWFRRLIKDLCMEKEKNNSYRDYH